MKKEVGKKKQQQQKKQTKTYKQTYQKTFPIYIYLDGFGHFFFRDFCPRIFFLTLVKEMRFCMPLATSFEC